MELLRYYKFDNTAPADGMRTEIDWYSKMFRRGKRNYKERLSESMRGL